MVMSMILMITFSLLFFFINHTLVLTIILTSQTINLSMMIFLKKNHSWFSYMLFMIFLSGMMIIFVYISSLASNQPLKMNKNYFFLLTSTLVTTTLISMKTNFTTMSPISSTEYLSPFLNSIMKIYENNLANFTILLIMYLLIVLIIIVNMSKKIKLPSRTY